MLYINILYNIIKCNTTLSYAFYCDCHNKSLCLTFNLNGNYSHLFDDNIDEKIHYHELLPDEYKIHK